MRELWRWRPLASAPPPGIPPRHLDSLPASSLQRFRLARRLPAVGGSVGPRLIPPLPAPPEFRPALPFEPWPPPSLGELLGAPWAPLPLPRPAGRLEPPLETRLPPAFDVGLRDPWAPVPLRRRAPGMSPAEGYCALKRPIGELTGYHPDPGTQAGIRSPPQPIMV